MKIFTALPTTPGESAPTPKPWVRDYANHPDRHHLLVVWPGDKIEIDTPHNPVLERYLMDYQIGWPDYGVPDSVWAAQLGVMRRVGIFNIHQDFFDEFRRITYSIRYVDGPVGEDAEFMRIKISVPEQVIER